MALNQRALVPSLTPLGHLAMHGDTPGYHSWEWREGRCYWHLVSRKQEASRYPVLQRKTPPTKNQPTQDISSTKDEKPWFTPISFKRQFHWFGEFIQRSLEPNLVIGMVHQAEKYHSWTERRDVYSIMGLISYIKISNMGSKKGFKQYQHSFIDSFIH